METLDVRALRAVPTPVADALLAGGCRTAGCIFEQPGALQLSLGNLRVKETAQVASQMLSACRREVDDAWVSADSALHLLKHVKDNATLTLPCRRISALLGNALRPGGSILEVCGLPGSGKTQFCLQVCAAAQIPPLGITSKIREAIYVDAEGSFVPGRFAQICRSLLAERRPGAGDELLEITMRNMHVCRTYDATELYASLKQLGPFLASRPQVAALVVDSLAFSFRHEFSDNHPLRARILVDIATMLRRYGAEHNLNVIVTNHMTTRFNRADVNQESGFLVPALGETWGHQPSTQLRLERSSGIIWNRGAFGAAQMDSDGPEGPPGKAVLTKSVERAVGQCCGFRIAATGLCDVDGDIERVPIA